MAQAMEDYYHTEYLTGRNSIGERVRAYKDLQDDSAELEMLFTVDILNEGAVEISIGGESVTFTATHLAEVQEIFRNEGWGDKTPKRRPVLGSSEGNEEDEEP